MSYSGSRDLNPALRQSDEYALRKTSCERKWTSKIKQVLTFIPGAEVVINVELGHPGSTDLQIEEDYGSLQPSSVTVSVGIPHSYYQRVRQAHGPSVPRATPNAASIRRIEAETAAKVRQAVAGLLPANLSPAAARVSVATFTDLQAAPPDAVDKTWVANALSNPVALCCILGMTVIGLLIAHGIWEDIQNHRLGAEHASSRSDAEPIHVMPIDSANFGRTDDAAMTSLGTTQTADGAIHKELTQLVRDDPDAAAEMLGEWVRKAS